MQRLSSLLLMKLKQVSASLSSKVLKNPIRNRDLTLKLKPRDKTNQRGHQLDPTWTSTLPIQCSVLVQIISSREGSGSIARRMKTVEIFKE